MSLVNKQCLKFRYFSFKSYDETTVSLETYVKIRFEK